MARWHIDELFGRHHTGTERRRERSRREVQSHAKPRSSAGGRSVVKDLSNPRRDIERLLAMGGGSFDALLDMLDGEPETPPMETALQAPGSEACLPQGYRLEDGSGGVVL